MKKMQSFMLSDQARENIRRILAEHPELNGQTGAVEYALQQTAAAQPAAANKATAKKERAK